MAIRLVTMLLPIVILAASGSQGPDRSRAFLMGAFDLSAADIGRLDRGEVISRTLDVKNRREIATLGIVFIKTPPSTYIERMADIATFKRAEGILQIGRFSSVPQAADVATLSIDQAELKRLPRRRLRRAPAGAGDRTPPSRGPLGRAGRADAGGCAHSPAARGVRHALPPARQRRHGVRGSHAAAERRR